MNPRISGNASAAPNPWTNHVFLVLEFVFSHKDLLRRYNCNAFLKRRRRSHAVTNNSTLSRMVAADTYVHFEEWNENTNHYFRCHPMGNSLICSQQNKKCSPLKDFKRVSSSSKQSRFARRLYDSVGLKCDRYAYSAMTRPSSHTENSSIRKYTELSDHHSTQNQ